MKKISYEDRYQCYLDYRDKKEDVEVTDFKSAVERCRQKVCKNFKRKQAEYKRNERKKQAVKDREYKYQGEILSGERKVPSAEKLKSFVGAMKGKYGSLYNYHLAKETKVTDSGIESEYGETDFG